TNTVSVLEADKLAWALGEQTKVTSVLLQASDKTTEERLGRREQGDSLRDHVARSARAARFLDARSPRAAHRITTDTLEPDDIAEEIIQILGW
ncbi:ATPase, partial [Corynebacterium variabile]